MLPTTNPVGLWLSKSPSTSHGSNPLAALCDLYVLDYIPTYFYKGIEVPLPQNLSQFSVGAEEVWFLRGHFFLSLTEEFQRDADLPGLPIRTWVGIPCFVATCGTTKEKTLFLEQCWCQLLSNTIRAYQGYKLTLKQQQL